MRVLLKYCAGYIRLAVFAIFAVTGMQIPSFIVQYEQRLDAQLRETQSNLAGFVLTASRYFEGDINKLITYYRNSGDAVFMQDANSIEQIVDRQVFLTQQAQQLDAHSVKQAMVILRHANTPLFEQTVNAFSFNVPLNTNALFWGGGLALVFTLLFDFIIAMVLRLFGSISTRKSSQHG